MKSVNANCELVNVASTDAMVDSISKSGSPLIVENKERRTATSEGLENCRIASRAKSSVKSLPVTVNKTAVSSFEVMKAEALAFEDAAFDNVICVEAAFHFETRLDFFREALRVLKP
ncbi:MAG: methyltransferase domain-containing protein, partial [Planctomycetota bacterium]